MGLLNGPLRMRLKQVANWIDHFRLKPDAKLDPPALRLVCQIGQTMRQLVSVDLPITQPRLVVVARVLVAEPAIVQQEGVRPHFFGPLEKRHNTALVERKAGGFPIIQHHRPDPIAVANAVTACPAVEIPAELSLALPAPRPEHGRCGKDPVLGEPVLGPKRVDAGDRPQLPAHVQFEGKLKTPRPLQRAAIDLARFFLGHPIQGHQEDRSPILVGPDAEF